MKIDHKLSEKGSAKREEVHRQEVAAFVSAHSCTALNNTVMLRLVKFMLVFPLKRLQHTAEKA